MLAPSRGLLRRPDWSTVITLSASLVLALVFALSSVTKALDLSGTRHAVRAFGLPGRLVGPLAIALPPLELVIAGLVLQRPQAGAGLALLLLTVVSAAVTWNLAHGRRPPCHCFGRLLSAEVSLRTLARNLVLCIAAIVVLLTSPSSSSAQAGTLGAQGTAASLALGLGLVACLLAIDAKAKHDPTTSTAVEPAPSRSVLTTVLQSTSGAPSSPADLRRPGRPLLLVFLSPSCPGCTQLAPRTVHWGATLGDHLDVAVVVVGDGPGAAQLSGEADAMPVLVDEQERLAAECGLVGYPAAVLVSPDETVTGPLYGSSGAVSLVIAGLHAAAPVERRAPAMTDDQALQSWAPTPRPGVSVSPRPDGGAVLTDALSGAIVQLDRLGALLWSCYDGRSSLADVGAELADAFDAPVPLVTADVLNTTRDIARQGMLWGASAASAHPGDGRRGQSAEALLSQGGRP